MPAFAAEEKCVHSIYVQQVSEPPPSMHITLLSSACVCCLQHKLKISLMGLRLPQDDFGLEYHATIKHAIAYSGR